MAPMILPEYQSHKRVQAARILEVMLDNVDEPTHGTLLLDGYQLQHHRVTAAWIKRHQPEIGGYFVQYADGYESYSPAKAFHEGHTPVALFQEERVRFCPDCGSIGEVPAGARDCCPGGSHARRIPKSLAERCRATSQRAIKPALSEIETLAGQTWNRPSLAAQAQVVVRVLEGPMPTKFSHSDICPARWNLDGTCTCRAPA